MRPTQGQPGKQRNNRRGLSVSTAITEAEIAWFRDQKAKYERGEPSRLHRVGKEGNGGFLWVVQGNGSEQPDEQAEAFVDVSVAVNFLEKLRPGGPWLLTAIIPDGATTTITARTPAEVEAFIEQYNGTHNLYYSVNPTRTALSKKAAKTDIAAIEYALGDLDPNKEETAEAAKKRYLQQLDGFEQKPTAAIDSGNGIQALWRLQERIELGEPIKAKGKTAFSPEDQAKIADVEARIAAIMVGLGSKAGTQNIDRILRLPGTTNLPNEAKLKAGRVPCQTELLWFDDVAYPLEAFPKPSGANKKKEKGSQTSEETDDGVDILNDVIENGRYEYFDNDRSKAVWFVVNELLRRGYVADTIVKVLLDRDYAISEHIYDQAKPQEYAERSLWVRSGHGRTRCQLDQVARDPTAT